MWLEDCHAPYFEYHPPWRSPESKEDEEAPVDFNLEAPLELGSEVNHFLQRPAESLEEEDRKMSSPEPPVEDLESWVTWRAQTHEIPGWWQELAKVPGVETMRNGHVRCGPLSNSPKGLANGARWRIITKPHWYHRAFIKRVSCHCLTPNSPARTSGNFSRRRQWPMPKPSSFRWKRPICLLKANHTCWQGA